MERSPATSPEEQAEAAKVSRRDFLAKAGWTALFVAAAPAVAALARFLNPNVVSPAPGPVEIGLPDDYAAGSLTFIEQARVYLGRDARGCYAILAACTHLGCTPRLEGDAFVCPCHGSRYTRDGQVAAAPASRALDRAFVGRAANGHLFVDRGRLVDPDYRLPVSSTPS